MLLPLHGLQLLFDSNIDILERIFEEVNKVLPSWGLQIVPKNAERRFY